MSLSESPISHSPIVDSELDTAKKYATIRLWTQFIMSKDAKWSDGLISRSDLLTLLMVPSRLNHHRLQGIESILNKLVVLSSANPELEEKKSKPRSRKYNQSQATSMAATVYFFNERMQTVILRDSNPTLPILAPIVLEAAESAHTTLISNGENSCINNQSIYRHREEHARNPSYYKSVLPLS